mmetsp:Transcript_59071/g.183070  ORF Transcript_59071/g.183070 Transcript_59071/m.183070 type:complete len:214 (+) Transcript_59071:1451-2092(+)
MSSDSSAAATASSTSPSLRCHPAMWYSSKAACFRSSAFTNSAWASFAARNAPSFAPLTARAQAITCSAYASAFASPRSRKIGNASSHACFASSAFFLVSPFFSRQTLASTSCAAASIVLSPSPRSSRTASEASCEACSTASAEPLAQCASARESSIFASPLLSAASRNLKSCSLASASPSPGLPVQQSTWATRRTASAVPAASLSSLKAASAS